MFELAQVHDQAHRKYQCAWTHWPVAESLSSNSNWCQIPSQLWNRLSKLVHLFSLGCVCVVHSDFSWTNLTIYYIDYHLHMPRILKGSCKCQVFVWFHLGLSDNSSFCLFFVDATTLFWVYSSVMSSRLDTNLLHASRLRANTFRFLPHKGRLNHNVAPDAIP